MVAKAHAVVLLIGAAIHSSPALASGHGDERRGVPQRRSIYELTDEIDVAADCAVKKGRAKYGPICDLAPAFERTFARCTAELPESPSGCVITIAPGSYELTRPLTICRPHVIRGAGGGAFNPATKIYTPDGLTPFRFGSFGECKRRKQPGAAGAELAHVALEAYAQTSTTPFFGLSIAAKIVVEHVAVRGYTQGIRVIAWAKGKGDLAANANAWWIADVWVDQSAHAGIFVDGPDANAGLALRPVATSNCQDASRFAKALGPCANIFAGEFLGSTYVAAQTASARDGKTGEAYPGYILGDSASSRSVCVGCYAEGDQATNILAQSANAFGGLAHWQGSGWFIGPQIGGLSLLNDRDPKNPVRLVLGNLASSGTFLEMAPVKNEVMSWPLRFKLDLKQEAFRLDVGGADNALPMLIGASKQGSIGLGELRLLNHKSKPSLGR